MIWRPSEIQFTGNHKLWNMSKAALEPVRQVTCVSKVAVVVAVNLRLPYLKKFVEIRKTLVLKTVVVRWERLFVRTSKAPVI